MDPKASVLPSTPRRHAICELSAIYLVPQFCWQCEILLSVKFDSFFSILQTIRRSVQFQLRNNDDDSASTKDEAKLPDSQDTNGHLSSNNDGPVRHSSLSKRNVNFQCVDEEDEPVRANNKNKARNVKFDGCEDEEEDEEEDDNIQIQLRRRGSTSRARQPATGYPLPSEVSPHCRLWRHWL